MNEVKPHYSFHLLGIMVCLGLLAFTLNRIYYPVKTGGAVVPGANSKADTTVQHR